MSAYASLVSLRHHLVAVLYDQPPMIQKPAKLQFLLEEVEWLLNFLYDYSSTQISELEAKMRDAARKAEDLVEHGILDSDFTVPHYSTKAAVFYFLPLFVIIFLVSDHTATYIQVIPDWIFISLVELLLCTAGAVFSYKMILAMNVFTALDDSQGLRGVLYDFKMIVKEVNLIREARGEVDMSSCEALVSLCRILDSILDGSGESGHLRTLQEMVSFLLDFLGNASSAYMSSQNMDATITHAVSKAKRALVEFQFPRKFSLHFRFSSLMALFKFNPLLVLLNSWITMTIRYECYTLSCNWFVQGIVQLCISFASYVASVVLVHIVLAAKDYSDAAKKQELMPHVIDDFRAIVTEAIKIKDATYGDHPGNLPFAAAASLSKKNLRGASKDVVVGLDNDLIEIKARLLQDSSKRELAFIVGMGGIGKTTLAREVYKDPYIVNHFVVRAWVTVSQEYSFRHVLLCLLHSARILTEEEEKCQDDDDKLALYLYQYLMHRRYLIVIDDVWDIDIWDSLNRFCPENDNGSRILITSRLPTVASSLDSSSPLHHMQCLNEDESWYLLRQKTFGEEGCPLELESIGREIATSCRGLPLAIVVTAGLIYQDIKIEVWRDVAEKLKKSELQDIKEQCLEILGLSYNHLPHHLRPCFLYMAVLPRDCEIPISRLISLWVAEGFMLPWASKTMEEMAEGYLKDLINRNLISVSKKSCNGKMRTCSMHDLLRDVCVHNAHKENFLHVVESGSYVTGDESPHRLSIHPDALQVDAKHKYVRSLLCNGSKSIGNPPGFYLGFVYLRVLDVLQVEFSGQFPHQIIKLIRLRYLSLNYNGPLPRSILNLYNLQTIVHHCRSFGKYLSLPLVIWRMPYLRHIYVMPGCNLNNPFRHYRFLIYLQTLVGIRNFKWSKDVIGKIPNLKKLGISYDVPSCVDWSTYQLDSLVDLHRLETLKIIIKYNDAGSAISCDPPKLAFPQKLRKLSLSGCRIPWVAMTAIGALPNLEALKLRCEACSGSSWETAEGEFPQLIFLLLEQISFTWWETDASHFPRLQRLVIKSCDMLEEIPYTLGDIPTLEMIKLVDCHPCAVASANEIQQEQESMGNEDLKVHTEQRRKECNVDKMDLRNLEASARGGVYVNFGRLQVLIDIFLDDMILQISVMLVLMLLVGVFDLIFKALLTHNHISY